MQGLGIGRRLIGRQLRLSYGAGSDAGKGAGKKQDLGQNEKLEEAENKEIWT